MKRSRYVTKKPFRTPREAKRDHAERVIANRIHELEQTNQTLQKALNARLEARPLPGELGELQRLLDNLRAVSHEVQSSSCSPRAMQAVTDLIPWGRVCDTTVGGFYAEILRHIQANPGEFRASHIAARTQQPQKTVDAVLATLVARGVIRMRPNSTFEERPQCCTNGCKAPDCPNL